MLDKPEIYVVDSIEVKRIAEERSRGGWLFSCPKESHLRISFAMRFAAIVR